MVKDPVTQQLRYFRQHGVVYGSSSAPKRWEDTLYPWIRELDSTDVDGVRVPGFVQGENEKSVFRHARRNLVVGCYVDDSCIRGPKAEVLWFLEKLAERFNCKDPIFFSEKVPIDHLGMSYFMHEGDVHLTMENYVAAMLVNCDMTDVAGKSTPISTAITDLTPLSRDESKWFMRGNGMCGWLAMTGRPDIKYAHSRISQHMAAPCRGALKALKHLIAYCKETQYWCFRQTAGSKDVIWSFYSDSDHAGNAESQNERRSQLGRMAMLGSVPIDWGLKASSVEFGEDAWRTDVPPGGLLVCHPLVKDLHTDVSSAASEIYAASVALSEFLHLSYVSFLRHSVLMNIWQLQSLIGRPKAKPFSAARCRYSRPSVQGQHDTAGTLRCAQTRLRTGFRRIELRVLKFFFPEHIFTKALLRRYLTLVLGF